MGESKQTKKWKINLSITVGQKNQCCHRFELALSLASGILLNNRHEKQPLLSQMPILWESPTCEVALVFTHTHNFSPSNVIMKVYQWKKKKQQKMNVHSNISFTLTFKLHICKTSSHFWNLYQDNHKRITIVFLEDWLIIWYITSSLHSSPPHYYEKRVDFLYVTAN